MMMFLSNATLKASKKMSLNLAFTKANFQDFNNVLAYCVEHVFVYCLLFKSQRPTAVNNIYIILYTDVPTRVTCVVNQIRCRA